MASFPTFIARRLAGSAFAALLALGATTAHAQVMPKPAPSMEAASKNVAYFVDGKLATKAEMQALDPNNIESIDVVKDAAQKKALGQASSDGVALVTTKAGANSPEVQALNKRFPKQPATPAHTAAVAAATAYVTQHYPAAKLEMVFPAKGQTDRYTAIFEENGKRLQLLFDGKGNPVER